MEAWDTSYFYDEPSGMSSIVDPSREYIPRAPPTQTASNLSRFSCKLETQGDNLNFLNNHDHMIFSQLPQLESPSLPLIKRPMSSLLTETSNSTEEEIYAYGNNNNNKMKKKLVTDWRALDQFVASQLSHEEKYMIHGGESNDDMESLLLFQSGHPDEMDSNDRMGGYSIGTDQCDNMGTYMHI